MPRPRVRTYLSGDCDSFMRGRGHITEVAPVPSARLGRAHGAEDRGIPAAGRDELEILADLGNRLSASVPAFRRSNQASVRLERIESLMQQLGRPELKYPVVHVGGTSGKGSVAAIIASILSHGGRKVGLHVSPYVHTLTEAWQLDGVNVLPSRILPVAIEVIKAARALPVTAAFGPVSYFELKVAIAFRLFADEGVDAAVIEVGLGGERDATNVVRPRVAVLTNVGLDHTEILGDTVEHIAADKAGIVKPGCVIVSGVQQSSAKSVLWRKAARAGVEALILGDEISFSSSGPELTVTWGGRELTTCLPANWDGFQVLNAVLAIVASAEFDPGLQPATLDPGVSAVKLPARLEVFSEAGKTIVLDGAHNADKVAAAAEAITSRFPDAIRAGVLALKDTKDPLPILARLAPLFSSFVLTTFTAGLWQAIPPAELFSGLQELRYTGDVKIEADPVKAVDAALAGTPAGGLVVVIGSLYLAGNVRGRWVPPLSEVLHGGSYSPRGPADPGERPIREP